ncbi:MAG: GNAT family N-acetyltransferase [Anaerocolumna aminovalerica]|jgi:ribosomal-protein-alanine N-acetyltransferase|uniref:GNAT family N-acetyltransferase n=1 Tax=Anaerocolumna aminovalerica TaxID=1527 RepID=UPI001C0ED9EB|nr:GNAT family N-acetyltransferase [Anaerocolumna aminovalerica]MBU5331026.1 GNAT family N-acetyltransferase [Anaerocolumna aminovalerica]MDU6264086.1 GNAT family N-acetyltransferase [Anaerocolumna aminovalerica]
MANIIIRDYKQQDWARIEEIHDSARKIELHLAGLDDAFVPLAQAAVNEGLFDYTICVALINDNVVGFVAYSDDEIAWLYVDPDSMRQGVGKSLIMHVIENTTRPLELEVLVGNNPALHLYEAMGFETTEICSGVMPGNESFEVTVHSMQQKKDYER